MRFDGLEVTTALVFYILYKYNKDADVLKGLELVNIDSCRFVTDFGLELLAYATSKSQLVKSTNCLGCTKLLKYKYQEVQLDMSVADLFTASSFNSVFDNSEENSSSQQALNACKIHVLNATEISLVKFMQNKLVVKETCISAFGQVDIVTSDQIW